MEDGGEEAMGADSTDRCRYKGSLDNNCLGS